MGFAIYIWSILSGIKSTLLVASAIVAFIAALSWLHNEDEELKAAVARAIKISVATMTLGLLLPSSKAFALIYILPRVMESRAIAEDLPELYEIAIEHLKDQANHDQ